MEIDQTLNSQEEHERGDEDAFTMEEMQNLSVTKSNEDETRSKQSQNNFTSFVTPSSTKNEENQLAGGSEENKSYNDRLDVIVELDGLVEADEDSNTKKDHRGLSAKEAEFKEKYELIVELEFNEVSENSTVVDLAPIDPTVAEEIVEEEIVDKAMHYALSNVNREFQNF